MAVVGTSARRRSGRVTERHTHRFSCALIARDGTMIRDVAYNGDPTKVDPFPGVRRAIDRLRGAGLRIGVVSNQSGIGRGLLRPAQVAAVNARVEALLGPFDTWQICPHSPEDGCGCRKPRAGLVLAAARELGVDPAECVVVGDIGADVAAAQAAGATGVLVPTPQTLRREVAQAPTVRPDLTSAVNWILDEAEPVDNLCQVASGSGHMLAAPVAPTGRRVVIVRPDSDGDVLLTGPAIRAVAARAGYVALWCGPRGRGAALLLPGIDEVIQWRTPWIDPEPPEVGEAGIEALLDRLRAAELDEAIVVTSFHQSALPSALLLRMAGVGRISAISDDYPGSLLDLRHRMLPGVSEAEQALGLVAAAGYPRPAGDDGTLRLTSELPDVSGLLSSGRFGSELPNGYIVLHPGASVPARSCPPGLCARFVTALTHIGHRVVVTGSPGERELTAYVSEQARKLHSGLVTDLGGRTSLAELASVLAGAGCVVVANTGPAHLAAAVGTPVVSLFAPTVPFEQWRPYGVPYRRLGVADSPCRGSRAQLCPVAGHPCLSSIDPAKVVSAVASLTAPSTPIAAAGTTVTGARARVATEVAR